ncbi:MAG TPA: DUF262 domain-containing protein [Xanthobacteraceae bacterium]|nr:DUF262 domain-containing protein [Xanthobacteraceae bacterium]
MPPCSGQSKNKALTAAKPVPIGASSGRAPESSVDRIEELAGRVLRGDILLPKFQRDFVWERHQIIDLLDSVANNYPIGSVLLWRSHEKLRSERNIADLEIAPTPHGYPVNYLLDGQQRLPTICVALYSHGADSHSRWNLAYDLRDKKFVHLDSLDDPPLQLIRLNKITDASAYFQHVAGLKTLGAADVQPLEARAKELFDRFKDYKIATVTLHEMSIQAVAPIFERINSRRITTGVASKLSAALRSTFLSNIGREAELPQQNDLEVCRGSVLQHARMRLLVTLQKDCRSFVRECDVLRSTN